MLYSFDYHYTTIAETVTILKALLEDQQEYRSSSSSPYDDVGCVPLLMTSLRAAKIFSQTVHAQEGSFTLKLDGKYSAGMHACEHFPHVRRLQFRQCTAREVERNVDLHCIQHDRVGANLCGVVIAAKMRRRSFSFSTISSARTPNVSFSTQNACQRLG